MECYWNLMKRSRHAEVRRRRRFIFLLYGSLMHFRLWYVIKTMVLREIVISDDFNFENYSRLLGNFSIRRCNVESPDSPRGIRLLRVSRCIYPRMKLVGYFPTPDRVVRWIPPRRVTRKGEKVVRVWEGLRQILASGWPVTRAVTHRPRCTCLGVIVLLYWFISPSRGVYELREWNLHELRPLVLYLSVRDIAIQGRERSELWQN